MLDLCGSFLNVDVLVGEVLAEVGVDLVNSVNPLVGLLVQVTSTQHLFFFVFSLWGLETDVRGHLRDVIVKPLLFNVSFLFPSLSVQQVHSYALTEAITVEGV